MKNRLDNFYMIWRLLVMDLLGAKGHRYNNGWWAGMGKVEFGGWIGLSEMGEGCIWSLSEIRPYPTSV